MAAGQPSRARVSTTPEDLISDLLDRVAALEGSRQSAAGTWVIEERDGEVHVVNHAAGRDVRLT